MTSYLLRILTFFMGIIYLTGSCAWIAGQDKSRFVEITGLSRTYSSCVPVDVSIRNISKQDIYVEVYVDIFKSGSWDNVDCQYDIKDPRSRHIKRLLINPKMTKPGESFTLSYDRCSDFEVCFIPMFGKNDVRASRLALMQEDAKAATPVTQRFRVEIHVRDPENVGRVKRVAKEYSQAFTRVPDRKTH